MNDTNTNRPHISFWMVGALALIWNLMGVMNFVGQLNPNVVTAMPESHQAIIHGRPAWATIAFAIAVFGGTLGSILLLFKKTIAQYCFLASLIGVMAQMIPNMRLAKSDIQYGLFEIFMMMVLPLLVAAFLAWYTSRTSDKGWIK